MDKQREKEFATPWQYLVLRVAASRGRAHQPSLTPAHELRELRLGRPRQGCRAVAIYGEGGACTTSVTRCLAALGVSKCES